jgi:thioredoxin
MKIAKQVPVLYLLIALSITACGQNTDNTDKIKIAGESLVENQSIKKNYKVTFIELGSVKCIPCQQMQPVMKSIEEKYGDKVKVVFHDVWTEDGAPYAKEYGIESIPTQVFLDEKGKEFFRHVGFFAEADLVKVLNSKDIF